ncbi:YceK/YidQ family lipoprotein [Pseudomonas asuensis]
MTSAHLMHPPSFTLRLRRNAVPLIAVDMAVSGILDTLLLPYTIYQQNKYGSMEINSQ